MKIKIISNNFDCGGRDLFVDCGGRDLFVDCGGRDLFLFTVIVNDDILKKIITKKL